MKHAYKILLLAGTVLLAYLVPLENMRVEAAVLQSFWSLQDFIQSRFLWHILPAILVSGLLLAFVPKDYFVAVLSKKKFLWYIATLAVAIPLPLDSCMVVFPAIALYRLGASFGTTVVFLFAGPAVNLFSMSLPVGIIQVMFLSLIALITGLLLDRLFSVKVDVTDLLTDSKTPQTGAGALRRFGKMLLNLFYLCLPMFAGILLAAFFLGAPGGDSGIVPQQILSSLFSHGGLISSIVATVTRAIYFIPSEHVAGLVSGAMGNYEMTVVAYLLVGSAISLPGVFALIAAWGMKRSLAYTATVLVLVIATGLVFGLCMG